MQSKTVAKLKCNQKWLHFYKTRKSITSGQMIDMVWERGCTSLLFCENKGDENY